MIAGSISSCILPAVMSVSEISKGWLEQLPSGQFRRLFEHLPGTLFFAKDLELRLMMGNSAFIARCGKKLESEIIGLDDYQLFPRRLAGKYRENDLAVLGTGKPLMGILELFPDSVGHPDWSVTDKLPLFDREGRICGVCGTVRSYEGVRESLEPYLELQPAAEYLKRHFREKLNIAELARIVGMSERQLERKFQQTFQTSPRAYLKRIRILIAAGLLKRTLKSVTEIAVEVGFYDHSDLSRHFKTEMGESPSAYREEVGKRTPDAPVRKINDNR